jgi:hypothetical protein
MIIRILEHTPVWVWIVLAGVVALGYLQTRDREVSRSRALILPWAFVLLSLSAVSFGAGGLPLPLLVWGLGFTGAWSFGRRFVAVRGASWAAATERFHVPGSWLPMLLMVALFLSRYVFGVVATLSPALRADAGFIALTSLAYGTFAGLFWARGRSLLALSAAPGAPTADARARAEGI